MKKKIIAIDLETIANKAMTPFLPEVSANKTLKDPVKVAADIENKKKDQISKMGLDPMLNLICCSGWCSEKGSGALFIRDDSEEAEKELLLSFWEILSEYDQFVTFNGRSFDIRCIHLHGITHGIRPPFIIDMGKYNRPGSNHIDLRGILSGESTFAPGKLDFYCKKFLGVGKMEGIDGALVQSYYDMGMHEDILLYCTDDAEKTFNLFKKVEAAGILE